MNSAASLGITAKADAKAGTLTIVLPLKTPVKPSKTGKTLLIAGTDGAAESTVQVNGKTVILNVNAYIYAQDKGGAVAAAPAPAATT